MCFLSQNDLPFWFRLWKRPGPIDVAIPCQTFWSKKQFWWKIYIIFIVLIILMKKAIIFNMTCPNMTCFARLNDKMIFCLIFRNQTPEFPTMKSFQIRVLLCSLLVRFVSLWFCCSPSSYDQCCRHLYILLRHKRPKAHANTSNHPNLHRKALFQVFQYVYFCVVFFA